jgi:hypothetical protein
MSAIPIIPRNLPDPPPAGPLAPRTLERWDQFLGGVASGMGLPEAKLKYLMTTADIEACARIDGLQMQRWKDARLAGRKRKWTLFQFEDIFDLVASGVDIDTAVMRVKGVPVAQTDFYALVNADPELRDGYRTAKESYSLVIGENLRAEARNKEGDILETPKGPIPNQANVNRSKLIVETDFRYIAAYNAKLFGEKKDNVNVQVNIDHVGSLEAARERAKLQDKRVTPSQMKAAIDATFSEKQVTDVDPTPGREDAWDTQWREEK